MGFRIPCIFAIVDVGFLAFCILCRLFFCATHPLSFRKLSSSFSLSPGSLAHNAHSRSIGVRRFVRFVGFSARRGSFSLRRSQHPTTFLLRASCFMLRASDFNSMLQPTYLKKKMKRFQLVSSPISSNENLHTVRLTCSALL